jgi:hypothetical protein
MLSNLFASVSLAHGSVKGERKDTLKNHSTEIEISDLQYR